MLAAAHDSSGLFKVGYRPLMSAGFLAKSVFEQELVSPLHKVFSELTQSLLTELVRTPRAGTAAYRVPLALPVAVLA